MKVPDSHTVDSVLASLTLEEKISLLAGGSFWETASIPEKSIPPVKLSDGPNGARGSAMHGGPTSACFPCAVALAATWNPEEIRNVGRALGEEAKTKGANLLLGPTVCPHRHPLGGRNFESFSEDPYLCGIMAAEYILGLQEEGVGAAIKHFAANEQETFRHVVDVSVSVSALREIYLRPFEIAIKQASPWAVMTAYNSINGTDADCNGMLLQRVLRGEWGWDGLVLSDWGGTTSLVKSLTAGLDLEMPGPPTIRKEELIMKALESRVLSEAVIDDRARALLRFVARARGFGLEEARQEYAENKEEHRELIRRVGREGIVLLKNEDDILPLGTVESGNPGRTVALLGFSQEGLIHGGGSAAVNAHYKVSPAEGLAGGLEARKFTVQYAKGAHTMRKLPLMGDNVVDYKGSPGWTMEFLSPDNSQTITRDIRQPIYIPTTAGNEGMKIRAIALFRPLVSGSHYLSLSTLGTSSLRVNGEEIYQQDGNCPDLMAFILGCYSDRPTQYTFVAGKVYRIEILTEALEAYDGPSFMNGRAGFAVGFRSQQDHEADLLTEAVNLAQESDLAIVFTGNTAEWEAEGQDQVDFHLPRYRSQDRLVSAVAAANPNTIVINCTGVPVAMPWIDQVKAVLQAWFLGQESGNAIADVILGECSPSGKLPVTFPRMIEDTPAYGNFPGGMEKDGRVRVRYEEGVFVGYRFYDQSGHHREKVLFPFGYGLSYTSFRLHGVAVTGDGDGEDGHVHVQVKVSNVGKRRGAETVQVYAGGARSSIEHPVKILVAFQKITLDPEETKEMSLRFAYRDLAHYDEVNEHWAVEPGSYLVHVGTSIFDIDATGVLSFSERMTFLP